MAWSYPLKLNTRPETAGCNTLHVLFRILHTVFPVGPVRVPSPLFLAHEKNHPPSLGAPKNLFFPEDSTKFLSTSRHSLSAKTRWPWAALGHDWARGAPPGWSREDGAGANFPWISGMFPKQFWDLGDIETYLKIQIRLRMVM